MSLPLVTDAIQPVSAEQMLPHAHDNHHRSHTRALLRQQYSTAPPATPVISVPLTFETVIRTAATVVADAIAPPHDAAFYDNSPILMQGRPLSPTVEEDDDPPVVQKTAEHSRNSSWGSVSLGDDTELLLEAGHLKEHLRDRYAGTTPPSLDAHVKRRDFRLYMLVALVLLAVMALFAVYWAVALTGKKHGV